MHFLHVNFIVFRMSSSGWSAEISTRSQVENEAMRAQLEDAAGAQAAGAEEAAREADALRFELEQVRSTLHLSRNNVALYSLPSL